jgi:Zn-dependent protease with chaperone function
MSGGEIRAGERCPECAAPLVQSEPRFSRWCRGCDWNVDPQEQLRLSKRTKPPGRLVRLRRRIEDELAERLYAELASRSMDRPGWDLAAVTSVVIAVLVHLFTLGLVGLAGWLVVVAYDNVLAWVAIVLLVGIAFLMRPKFFRLDKPAVSVTREQTPRLYALVDEVSQALGGPTIQRIVLDTSYNAAVTAIGPLRRRLLIIGLPMWNVLDRQERVALLGHEIGHFVNSDPRRSLVVGSAVESLAALDELFSGEARPLIPGDDDFLTTSYTKAMAVLRMLVVPARAVAVALVLTTMQARQRAEYLADQLASKAGGTAANVSGLDAELLGALSMRQLAVDVRKARTPNLWKAQRAYVREFPALERERLRRAAAVRRSRVDESHPPTHLRIKLAEVPQRYSPAAVVLSQGEADAIERELQPCYDQLEKELRGELLRAMYQ